MLTTWDEQQIWQARAAAIAQNGARTGRSLHRVMSRGAGQTRMPNPIAFRVTFASQPTFTSGVSLGAGKLADGAYPVANVGVYAWQKDDRNFYIGAWLWVAVTVAPTTVVPQVQGSTLQSERAAAEQAIALQKIELEHHLCFEGLALRDVDYDRIIRDD